MGMDNALLIDKYNDELSRLIQKMHKDGISYATILFILSETLKNLNLMAYCENWLAEHAIGKGLVAGSD
jgi:hypothetical protein